MWSVRSSRFCRSVRSIRSICSPLSCANVVTTSLVPKFSPKNQKTRLTCCIKFGTKSRSSFHTCLKFTLYSFSSHHFTLPSHKIGTAICSTPPPPSTALSHRRLLHHTSTTVHHHLFLYFFLLLSFFLPFFLSIFIKGTCLIFVYVCFVNFYYFIFVIC